MSKAKAIRFLKWWLIGILSVAFSPILLVLVFAGLILVGLPVAIGSEVFDWIARED